MKRYGVDLIFCTSLRSIAYVGNVHAILGWYPKTVLILPLDEEPFFVIPRAERFRVEKESWFSKITTWTPDFIGIKEVKFEDIILDVIQKNKLERGKLGIEGNLAWPLYKMLTDNFPHAQFIQVDDMMEECMVIKDDYEISLMRKVAAICTTGYEAARDNVKPGLTEIEIAAIMEAAMRREGCTGFWTQNAVGTGEEVLLDHAPADAVFQENHYVMVGVHGAYKLYFGDICNVMALKKTKRDSDYVRLCRVVEEASRKTIDAMRPGVRSDQLFAIKYNHMAAQGYGKACNWFVGHGLGTGHQKPLIAPGDKTELKERMIIVLNGIGQMENGNTFINEVMLLITPDGAEQISKNPLGLVQL